MKIRTRTRFSLMSMKDLENAKSLTRVKFHEKHYDVSVLSRFNPKLNPKFNFTEGNDSIQFSAANERTPEKLQAPSSISPSTLLRTPIVEKAHRDESPKRQRFTPQSILKSASHASLPRSVTPLSYVSRKSLESKEKSIRFD